MRIALLTWEYPPRVVGEMAHDVEGLALGLSKGRPSVSVVTYHDAPYAAEKLSDRLEVHRVQSPVVPEINIVTWSLALSSEVQRVTANIHYDGKGGLNLVDVHDWHFVVAAVGLKKALGVPFVFSVHSLEEQRASMVFSPLSSCIKGIEWLGISESDCVLTRSEWMKGEVERAYAVPPYKVKVIDPSSKSWVSKTVKAYLKSAESSSGVA
jgi:hypothetical protein